MAKKQSARKAVRPLLGKRRKLKPSGGRQSRPTVAIVAKTRKSSRTVILTNKREEPKKKAKAVKAPPKAEPKKRAKAVKAPPKAEPKKRAKAVKAPPKAEPKKRAKAVKALPKPPVRKVAAKPGKFQLAVKTVRPTKKKAKKLSKVEIIRTNKRREIASRRKAVKTGKSGLNRWSKAQQKLIPESIKKILKTHKPKKKRSKRSRKAYLEGGLEIAQMMLSPRAQITAMKYLLESEILDWTDAIDIPVILHRLEAGMASNRFNKVLKEIGQETGMKDNEVYTIWLYR